MANSASSLPLLGLKHNLTVDDSSADTATTGGIAVAQDETYVVRVRA